MKRSDYLNELNYRTAAEAGNMQRILMNLKKVTLAMLAMFAMTACSDLLLESPKAVATETFYNSAAEIEGAVYAIYNSVGQATIKTTSGMVLINATEVDYAEGRVTFAPYSDFKGALATDTRIPNVWLSFYQAIRNANLVLVNAVKSQKTSESDIAKFNAEAKFLRAFSYFCMVRNWGGVPLRTEYNMMETDIPRSPVSEIYSLIISDLEYSELHLPDTQPFGGRATRFAAKALLADVYLQLEKWADARTKALEVINSGRYSLVKVTTSEDFYKIFGSEVVITSEEIFYIKANTTTGSYFCNYRHHPSVQYFNFKGAYALYSDSTANKVISEWDPKDLRKKFMLYNCDIGLGTKTMLFKKYVAPMATGAAANDWPALRYTDVLLTYAEADCRANNGPTSDGMQKLNMIHRRAYGKDPAIVSSVDFKHGDFSKETFIDLVLQEGCYEQMDEGKRFLALKRTGKLKSAVKYARGIDVADTHLLWPIPAVEYLYNGAIDPTKDQNPGY